MRGVTGTMPQGAREAVGNLLKAQRGDFGKVVDNSGQLGQGERVGGNRLQRFLVRLVARGTVSEGKFGGRIIKGLVGKKFGFSVLLSVVVSGFPLF